MTSEPPIAGVRVRVFGWPETWRVVPERTPDGWRLRIELAPDSAPGRAAPPFLGRTEWTAAARAEGLEEAKSEIRARAGMAHRRVFLVDEEPEDLDD